MMRLHAPSLRQGYDLILVARTRAVGSDYGKLEADVLRCLDQLHLLKKDGEE